MKMSGEIRNIKWPWGHFFFAEGYNQMVRTYI